MARWGSFTARRYSLHAKNENCLGIWDFVSSFSITCTHAGQQAPTCARRSWIWTEWKLGPFLSSMKLTLEQKHDLRRWRWEHPVCVASEAGEWMLWTMTHVAVLHALPRRCSSYSSPVSVAGVIVSAGSVLAVGDKSSPQSRWQEKPKSSLVASMSCDLFC